MNEELKIINDTCIKYGGYIYTRSQPPTGFSTYWDCLKVWYKECKPRAITVRAADGKIILEKVPDQTQLTHAPNQEEAEAEKIRLKLKRKAARFYHYRSGEG